MAARSGIGLLLLFLSTQTVLRSYAEQKAGYECRVL